ncbi:unnamed protein product [Tilletia controversa]|uniref:Thioredoxin-like fold domain-containing protein n=3 Tax=Tilletia TaxID=13289 RepID=A0A8X7SXV8_9BASI|nr:hypothetical protein CF336_g3220 [Tilletia laevis]KAE8200411.1 hypothetical protein CF328_g2973 [Tilletia controversa]KAE8262371.1 hypothetical protein A4X03_0g2506 [Tilletia caries]KAE8205454.1 hypothetical protein CF335_g2290 [Tilletia laevis]KAE8248422.1 hypothetical protein A4X06_0g3729 [Tilletia controversa]
MALPRHLDALAMGKSSAPNTLELWLDYLCPFSAKQLLGVEKHLFPLIFNDGAKYLDRVRLVIRPTPQPWHGSSTYLHEAALASISLGTTSEKIDDQDDNPFWLASIALMQNQTKFFDVPAKNKTAAQIRDELAAIVRAAVHDTKDAEDEVRSLIEPQGDGNAGSEMVADLKYCVKMGRQNGVHVTPSVSFNGLLVNDISSSFGAKEWSEWLNKNIK